MLVGLMGFAQTPVGKIEPSNNNTLDVKVNGTERFSINGSTGNVGIGTTSPTKKLDVAGDVRIQNLPQGASTDNIVVADTNGNLKTVASSSLQGSTFTPSSQARFLKSMGSIDFFGYSFSLLPNESQYYTMIKRVNLNLNANDECSFSLNRILQSNNVYLQGFALETTNYYPEVEVKVVARIVNPTTNKLASNIGAVVNYMCFSY